MEQQMQQLQTRLEDLRRSHLRDRLDSDEVLAVLDEARALRDQARGSAMEGTLEVILDLLQTVQRNADTRETLRECRRALAQVN